MSITIMKSWNEIFHNLDKEEEIEKEAYLIVGQFLHFIDKKMQEQSLTKAELGRRAGVSAWHITRIMRGEKFPSFITLARLADAVGIRFHTYSQELTK